MIKKDLSSLAPVFPLPENFSVVKYHKHSAAWAKIDASPGNLRANWMRFATFVKSSPPLSGIFPSGCFLSKRRKCVTCATSCAWYGTWYGVPMGRLHWVAVMPKYQGLGLSKALVTRCLYTLANYHDMAYLTSQTISYKAIKVYLDNGFVPF